MKEIITLHRPRVRLLIQGDNGERSLVSVHLDRKWYWIADHTSGFSVPRQTALELVRRHSKKRGAGPRAWR